MKAEVFDGPKDVGNKVYYSMMYLGFASLLPWSCILNSFDFMAHEVKKHSLISLDAWP
jgi:hypothetical protein